MKGGAVAIVIAVSLIAGDVALGHEVRPAYLELAEREPRRFDVLWKVPSRGSLRLGLDVVLPESCVPAGPRTTRRSSGATVERWTVTCTEGLAGQTVHIEGLEATLTDVLVRTTFHDAAAHTARLAPLHPSFVIPREPTMGEVAATYLALGVEHILGGIDHLLFVLALLLLVRGWRQLIGTVTAFTVAHSVTLALASLGFVHASPAPVEAAIALSIVFVATEIVHGRQGRPGLTERYPWVVAVVFGLLHGFGFAGALSEVGLPESAIPLALFLFNVGVEIGQLLFVAVALAVMWAGRRAPVRWPDWTWAVPAYFIGTVAAFWTVQRIVAFW